MSWQYYAFGFFLLSKFQETIRFHVNFSYLFFLFLLGRQFDAEV
jgi:hypothetical protein